MRIGKFWGIGEMKEIKFGTDGYRAIIGNGFDDEVVLRITNGAANYVYKYFGIDKKFVVGYDPRFEADRYAGLCAEYLSKLGFEVFLSDKVLPTPVLAYACKRMNAAGIMFTASHNPPEYLGMKFIPDYGGPAQVEATDELVSLVDKPFEKSFEPKVFQLKDFRQEYFDHLKTLVDFEKIKNSDVRVFYDALHSAGANYFDYILNHYGVCFSAINLDYDPQFGGGMPEPNRKYLKPLCNRVLEGGYDVGFSNDGDADRYGVVNELGEFVTPNEVLAMLLLHLVKNKGLQGGYVKTVAGSNLHKLVAAKLGIVLFETAVGFKWVAKEMMEHSIIIGGEESGGLSILGHIPEKDGILANLLVLEMLAYEKKPLSQLQKELVQFCETEFYNDRIDLHLQNSSEQKELLSRFENGFRSAGGLNVKNTNNIDGIKFELDDDLSWVLVRSSGTEPLLRIYVETTSNAMLQKIKSDITRFVA